MKIQRYLAALLVAPALTLSQPSLAQDSQPGLNQELTMKAKPAVVRIINLCYGYTKDEDNWDYDFDLSFLGTGFFINPDGYIVTSADVIDQEECEERIKRNIEKSSNISSKKKNYLKDNLKVRSEGGVILPSIDEKQTYHFFDIKKSAREFGKPSQLSQKVAVIKIAVKDAPTLKLQEFSNVQIQDHILAIGYPVAADLKKSNSLKSFYEASVTEGRISNPHKTQSDGNPILQVDILAPKGNDGSPVLNDQGEVIAMLVSDSSSDGSSVPSAVPTSTIMQYIRQSGGTNQDGATDKLYAAGLELLWNKDYKGARAKFEAVRGLFPNHSEVNRLISFIDQRLAEEWVNPFKNPTYQLLFALVAGGGVIAALAYFLLRRKSSASKVAAASPGVSAVKTPFSENGAGIQSWLELEYKGQTRQLPLSKDEHHLGRDPKWSDVTVPNNWDIISSKHATLRKEGEDYRIYDGHDGIHSTNGLWIDEDIRVDLQDGYLLKNGDQLKIGKDAHEQITLTYFNPSSSQAGQPRETKMA